MKTNILSLLLLSCSVIPTAAQRPDNYCPPNIDVVFTQSTLPIVKIDVNGSIIQRQSTINAHFTIIDNGEGQTNYYNSKANPQNPIYDDAVTIKYTGNSTFTNSEKKSYLIQSANKTWELNAYAPDRSMVRTLLAHDLARNFMEKVPSTTLCEVAIDGIYYGVYYLSETIHSLLDDNDTLVSIDRNDTSSSFASETNPLNSNGAPINYATVRYKYIWPEEGNIATDAIIKATEQSLISGNIDSKIDVISFADYILNAEFMHNADSYRLHALMCFPEGKTALMLPGNAALGFGNYDAFEGFRSDTWVYRNNDILSAQDEPQLIPFYWYNLVHNAEFQSILKDRWTQYRNDIYTTEYISRTIDHHIDILKNSGAAERNNKAWNIWSRKLWPNYYLSSSLDDEVTYIKNWIGERLEWMDANIGKEEVIEPTDPSATYHTIPLEIISGFNTDCISSNRQDIPENATVHPALDNHGSVLVTTAMANGGKGLPEDGILVADNGHTFKFGDYLSKNCLYLDRTDATGTLTFSGPIQADSLCILLVGTNKENYDLKYVATINYTDGTSDQSETQVVSDWCYETYNDFVYRNLTRWRSDYNGGGIDGTKVNLSENKFKVNKNKAIKSVTFTSQCRDDAWGFGMLGIFAVSAVQRATSAIENIETNHTTKVIRSIHTLSGSLSTRLNRGINIVVYTDGSSEKVYIK